MIHELLEQKRKSHRTRTSKNTKLFQDHKTFSLGLQEHKLAAFEASDNENKEPESASTVFIPPWLRNSLRLTQRNNLSQPKVGPDSKTVKTAQRGRGQNAIQSLKPNVEQDPCKKPAADLEVLPQDEFRDVGPNQDAPESTDVRPENTDRRIPIYWRLRRKESDSGSSCSNLERHSLRKNDSRITSGEALVSTDAEKNKTEHKKKLKLFRAKDRTRKRAASDQKELELSKRDIDFLLEFKARDASVNSAKGNATSESKNREPKFLLLGGKPHNPNTVELNKEKFRLLQEIKNQGGAAEELEGVFEQVTDSNFPESPKNCNPSPKILMEKPGDREDKITKGITWKSSQEENFKADKDSLMSTDDEDDIKRFSEFLSKNKNLDEKRKCLEEVRNYFERKRRTRMTKRCVSGGERPKVSLRSDWKDDLLKERLRAKDVYRRRRSKLTLDEEAVEKAVDETLQKFLELYHFRMTPTSMLTMKKNILQAIRTDALEGGCSKFNELKISPAATKKINADVPTKDAEKIGSPAVFAERDVSESPRKEYRIYKDAKKKHFRTAECFGEPFSKPTREGESGSVEDENLRQLREDFNNFLHSIQGRFDFASLKLQSVILEKEDNNALGKSVQLVYSFGMKALESGRGELRSPHKIGLELKTRKDCQCQTVPEIEVSRKNARVGTVEQKSSCCEQGSQTEKEEFCTRDTQTETKGVTVREISELKSHEVSAGLYRMVRSKDAGKFYLYPEEAGKQKVEKPSRCYIAKGKRSKKTCFLNIAAKDRRVASKEKEKAKLKKIKRILPFKNHNLKGFVKKKRLSGTSEDSINCLYFRQPDKKASESMSSKKDLTDETAKDQFYYEERAGGAKEGHLACFWFWNGEKITPGCDLKIHVENIVKEKLTEMTHFESQQNEHVGNAPLCDASRRNLDEREVNTLFFSNDTKTAQEEVSLAFAESANQEERKDDEGKRKENCETRKPLRSASHEKAVKNVGTQNSQSLPLTPLKCTYPSRHKNLVRRKCTRRNIIIKPTPGRGMTLKKAEDIVRAIEEIKKIKLGLENPKNEGPKETERALRGSIITLDCKINDLEEHESKKAGCLGGAEKKKISDAEFETLEKLINVVDREVQTGEDGERENSFQDEIAGKNGQLELIESVLSGVSQKERERLWNGVREFIKTKIGRDINDEGTREVCIEIEQHVPRTDQGKMKRSVLARGHYSKNDGDVEMEIDLTLDDLARILRQRQRKIRRRNLCRSSKSRSLISGSSIQSDFTKQDFLRYQKYLRNYAIAEGGFSEDKESSHFRKAKPTERY